MKTCEEYAALLDPYVDGELSPEELAGVQAHLETCPACQAYVDDALIIRAAFPDVEDTEVPDGFAESVCAAIQAGAAPRKKKPAHWLKAAAPLAACCAIVLLLQKVPFGATKNAAMSAADTAAPESAYADASLVDTEESAPAAPESDTAPAETGTPNTSARQTPVPPAPPAPALMDGGASKSEQEPQADAPAAGVPQLYTPAADNSVPEEETAEDTWVEYDNVVFAAVVCLTADDVGSALDGYAGKPYSNASHPDEGVIGTGYALEQADFERILHEALNRSDSPALNQARTTELCCIVVTDSDHTSP